jgi:prolyl-tRNA synthetase
MEKTSRTCPKCKSKVKQDTSVEVGHIFCLGDKYSKAFNLQYVNKKGETSPVIMGCYGIGVGRLMGTIAEISHDDKGIIWPKQIAPFDVHLIPVNTKVTKTDIVTKLYRDLEEAGIEVLYDDRDNKSVGEKFAEADLIGVPLRIVASNRTLESNSVEIKERGKMKNHNVKLKIFNFEL